MLRAMTTPFRTARARERAPEILDFAATLGAAVLRDPTGTPALTSGDETAVARLLRGVRRCRWSLLGEDVFVLVVAEDERALR